MEYNQSSNKCSLYDKLIKRLLYKIHNDVKLYPKIFKDQQFEDGEYLKFLIN
jgi:hypothetical protein